MKKANFLYILLLCWGMILFNACGDDCNCQNGGECVEGLCQCPDGFSGPECETNCFAAIKGTWTVTNIQPSFCTLVSYEIGEPDDKLIIPISLNDGTQILTGNGLIESDCSELTYSVSNGGTIESGKITFDGNTLTDQSTIGCLFTATKQ